MNPADKEKKSLRGSLKEMRSELLQDKRAPMDKAIFQNVIALEEYKKASLILIYASTISEVDTRALIDYTLKVEKRIACPVCEPETHRMNFYEIKSSAELVPSYYGIDEPIVGAAELIKDFGGALCIVPALAFDRDGFRIGYGGGYYDRFLSENKDIFTVGLCYQGFLLDAVPRDCHDISVDCVVTENEIMGETNEA